VSGGAPSAASRLPLVPFLQVVRRRRRLFWTLTLGSALAAGLFCLVAPTTYVSTLTILPPESGSGLDMIGGDLQSSLAKLQIGFATMTSSDLFADMLKSRSVQRYCIDKLDLIHAWNLARFDSLKAYTFAYDILDKSVNVKSANNGLITMVARSQTRFFPSRADKAKAQHLAADIGNALADGLEMVNRQKNTSRAHQARLYLEQQLALTDARLEAGGDSLARFQKRHLAISLDDQMRVGIETAGKIEGELLAGEVALGVARQSMLPGNPEVQRLESTVSEMRRQLQGLQRGGPSAGLHAGDSLSWGLEELPDLSREYAVRLREVKIQEKVYELLTQQLHYARVKETETMPVIQVLDRAAVPAFKTSPLVRKTAALAGILGAILAVFLAHVLEWWERYPWKSEDGAFLRNFWRG
jgi:tyrosine-protein kinase Etk/Wzc